jgi:hypothetical protein
MVVLVVVVVVDMDKALEPLELVAGLQLTQEETVEFI